MMPEQRKQDNNGQWNAKQPQQSSSSEPHDFLLSLRPINGLGLKTP
jgi:hypothetical protein